MHASATSSRSVACTEPVLPLEKAELTTPQSPATESATHARHNSNHALAAWFTHAYESTRHNPVRYVPLQELVQIQRSNALLSKQHFAPIGLPYIQYGQIHTNKFLTQDHRYLTYIDPSDCSPTTKTVSAGDLLLTGVSEDLEGLARPLLWQGEEAVLSQSLLLLKFTSPDVVRLYLAYYFKSYAFHLQKYRLAIGTTIVNLDYQQLHQTLIPLPPLEVQREIGEFLWASEQLLLSRTAGIATEHQLRQLQLKYFTQLFFA